MNPAVSSSHQIQQMPYALNNTDDLPIIVNTNASEEKHEDDIWNINYQMIEYDQTLTQDLQNNITKRFLTPHLSQGENFKIYMTADQQSINLYSTLITNPKAVSPFSFDQYSYKYQESYVKIRELFKNVCNDHGRSLEIYMHNDNVIVFHIKGKDDTLFTEEPNFPVNIFKRTFIDYKSDLFNKIRFKRIFDQWKSSNNKDVKELLSDTELFCAICSHRILGVSTHILTLGLDKFRNEIETLRCILAEHILATEKKNFKIYTIQTDKNILNRIYLIPAQQGSVDMSYELENGCLDIDLASYAGNIIDKSTVIDCSIFEPVCELAGIKCSKTEEKHMVRINTDDPTPKEMVLQVLNFEWINQTNYLPPSDITIEKFTDIVEGICSLKSSTHLIEKLHEIMLMIFSNNEDAKLFIINNGYNQFLQVDRNKQLPLNLLHYFAWQDGNLEEVLKKTCSIYNHKIEQIRLGSLEVFNISKKGDPNFKNFQLTPTEYQDYFKYEPVSHIHLYRDYLRGNRYGKKENNYCDKEVITTDGGKIQMHSSVFKKYEKLMYKGDVADADFSIMEPYITSLYLNRDEYIERYVANGMTELPIARLLKYSHERGNLFLQKTCIEIIMQLKLSQASIEIIRKVNESIQSPDLTSYCDDWEAQHDTV